MASSKCLLRKMTGRVFARSLKASVTQPDIGYAFFLGAGCSISSGIPAARVLVKQVWLPMLQSQLDPHGGDLDTWAKQQFPDYDPARPAAVYGDVMEALFYYPEQRQREIERLCDGKSPGFGYAVLAALVAQHQGRFNVVLTTNFDDLVADALYLFTNARPLVIQHEALASYINPTRTRPLIVKLHGDQRLTPQNTDFETGMLKEGIDKQVRGLLQNRGLIFMGYGGHDKGIHEMLTALPQNALEGGVFWVSGNEPDGEIAEWLHQRRATWVNLQDFDEMMLLIHDTMDLKQPDQKRFERIFDNYAETYKKLSEKILTLPSTAPEAAALKEAVVRTDKTFNDAYGAYLEARHLEKDAPEKAEAIYREGIEQFTNSALLLGQYARFLHDSRKDFDRAEMLYERAIATDPNSISNLGNFARFLKTIRKDYKRAEELYKRAIASDPNNADNLGNYALFLKTIHADYDGAEEFYKRAIAADPADANNLGNFAVFLKTIRRDYSRAAELYQRAIVVSEPNNAIHLSNYASVLLAQGQREAGLECLARALNHPDKTNDPGSSIDPWFTALVHRPPDAQADTLKHIKELLTKGIRRPLLLLQDNIDLAVKNGHPESEWLPKLAAVIKDEADISILNEWPTWNSV